MGDSLRQAAGIRPKSGFRQAQKDARMKTEQKGRTSCRLGRREFRQVNQAGIRRGIAKTSVRQSLTLV